MSDSVELLKESMIELAGTVEELANTVSSIEAELAKLKSNANFGKRPGKFGGKKTKTAVLDKETGIVYPSKTAVGKAFAEQYGADPENTFAYYVVSKATGGEGEEGRFQPLPEDDPRAKEAWEKEAAELEEWLSTPLEEGETNKKGKKK
ncbi:MAG: hypothetical protein DRN95_02230 [Candidatus Hydrothermarchaeota archaeon]|nr:MAG: hypothetical protein DRN95_02230 [Candidatus Hydrothermarchaeota archaeon]